MKLIEKIAIFIIPIYVAVIIYNITLFCGNDWGAVFLSCTLTLIPFLGGIYFREAIGKIKNKDKNGN
jgi:predicted Na+-dependent transporter